MNAFTPAHLIQLGVLLVVILLLTFLTLKAAMKLFRLFLFLICSAASGILSYFAAPCMIPMFTKHYPHQLGLPTFVTPAWLAHIVCFLCCYLVLVLLYTIATAPFNKKEKPKE